MQKIELEVIAISHSFHQMQQFTVILGETNGQRRLAIVIGHFEAQAIFVSIEKMAPARPLTHDLIRNICDGLGITIKEVLVNNLMAGIFYARLICEKDGQIVEIDSRTSDAIALALRFNCPIYTYESIMEQASILFEDPDENPEGTRTTSNAPAKPTSQSFTVEELESQLEEALAQEDYERAARLRDEIRRRN